MLILELNPLRATSAVNILNFFWGVGAITCSLTIYNLSNSVGFFPISAVLAGFLLLIAVMLIFTPKGIEQKPTVADENSDVFSTPIWTNPLAWLIGAIVGFPPASPDVPVTVTIERSGDGEVWTRDFGGRRFSSRLTLKDGQLREQFGPLTFTLALSASAQGTAMPVAGWRLFGLPMPRFLAPRSEAFETQDADGAFRFDVRLTLPPGIALAHYRGWLRPAR